MQVVVELTVEVPINGPGIGEQQHLKRPIAAMVEMLEVLYVVDIKSNALVEPDAALAEGIGG